MDERSAEKAVRGAGRTGSFITDRPDAALETEARIDLSLRAAYLFPLNHSSASARTEFLVL